MTAKRLVIQFRVTAKEKRAIVRAARIMRVTVSQFLRQRVAVR